MESDRPDKFDCLDDSRWSLLANGLEGGDDENKNADGDYVEKRKFCFCCSLKCGLIFVGILLVIDFIFILINCIMATLNPFFDDIYKYIYWAIIFVIFVAVILQIVFWCGVDSPGGRSVLPWSFLIASIANILLFIWIIVYICAIYPRNKIWLPKNSSEDADYYDDYDEDSYKAKHRVKSDHYTESKTSYVIFESIGPLINGLCFLLFYVTAKDWVDRHANQ